jgi:hypothetical protein
LLREKEKRKTIKFVIYMVINFGHEWLTFIRLVFLNYIGIINVEFVPSIILRHGQKSDYNIVQRSYSIARAVIRVDDMC